MNIYLLICYFFNYFFFFAMSSFCIFLYPLCPVLFLLVKQLYNYYNCIFYILNCSDGTLRPRQEAAAVRIDYFPPTSPRPRSSFFLSLSFFFSLSLSFFSLSFFFFLSLFLSFSPSLTSYSTSSP